VFETYLAFYWFSKISNPTQVACSVSNPDSFGSADPDPDGSPESDPGRLRLSPQEWKK
jgi:hypothetical protein